MSSEINVNDLVEFTDECTAMGAAKCRVNKTPGRVVNIAGSKHKVYLVDAGLGYYIYAGINDIKKNPVQEEAVSCQV